MTHPSCPESTPAARLTEERESVLLRTILNIARRLCPADAYAIWQREAGSGEWRSVADAGLSEAYTRSIVLLAGSLPGKVMHFEDVSCASLLEDRAAGYRAEGIRSLLVIPLTVRGEQTAT